MTTREMGPLQFGQHLIELGLAVQRREIGLKEATSVAKPKRLMKLIHSRKDWEMDIEPRDRLLSLLEIQEISRAQLAKTMGVTRQYMSDVVSGRKPISLKTARKLAKALKVHPRAIL